MSQITNKIVEGEFRQEHWDFSKDPKITVEAGDVDILDEPFIVVQTPAGFDLIHLEKGAKVTGPLTYVVPTPPLLKKLSLQAEKNASLVQKKSNPWGVAALLGTPAFLIGNIMALSYIDGLRQVGIRGTQEPTLEGLALMGFSSLFLILLWSLGFENANDRQYKRQHWKTISDSLAKAYVDAKQQEA